MVAHLLQLKLRLLVNAFKRSPWYVVGMVLALVSALGIASVVSSALAGLRLAPVDLASSAITVFGSIVVLGFLLVPLVFGVEDVMDPRAFSLYGIPTGRLAAALAVAAHLSVSAVAVALIALGQVVTWSRGPLPLLLALLGAVVIVVTCILAARVSTSIAAFLLATRRTRDATGVVGIALLLALTPAFVLLLKTDWQRTGLGVLRNIAGFLSWTPLGAVWAAPADAAAGRVAQALEKEVIALAFLGLLWLAWRILVHAMLITQQRLAQARSYRGLGFFATLPSSQTWAIAARSLTYWVRDARYHVSLLVIPFVPLLLMVPLIVVGFPGNVLALMPVPVVAVFLSWSIHNDVAYDSTAVWLHVASPAAGRADRMGRAIPPLLVGIPVLAIGSLICAPLYGDWAVLPSIFGVGIGTLLCGLGFSSVMSARFPYPAVRPGDSPFAQPQAVGSAAAFVQSVSFVATFILASPTFILAFIGLHHGWVPSLMTLLIGTILGLIVFRAGISMGGAIFDRRSPELLAFTMRN